VLVCVGAAIWGLVVANANAKGDAEVSFGGGDSGGDCGGD
jgi:hypothetical protein